MRKELSIGALGTLLVVGSIASATYAGPKVEITFAHNFGGPDKPVMEQLIAKFNQTHPNIVVNPGGGDVNISSEQLPALVAAGKAPDLTNIFEIPEFAERGAITPITATELKAAGIEKSRFVPAFINAGAYKGKTYGVPSSAFALVVYYNKDLLKKAGVASLPKSSAQFITAAQACTTDKAGRHPTEAGFDGSNLETWGFGVNDSWISPLSAWSVTRQNGVELWDTSFNPKVNTATATQSMQFVVDLIRKYHVSPVGLTEMGDIAAFRQGRSCFIVQGTWILNDLVAQKGLNFGVMGFPRFGKVRDATFAGVNLLVLPKQPASYDRNRRLAALELMNWLTSHDQNLVWSGTGAPPLLNSVASAKEYASNPMSGVVEGLKGFYMVMGAPWTGQIRSAWEQAFASVLAGKRDVKSALAEAQSQAERNVTEARKNY